ncbi:MarR family winged helix-turn-helix transcriptional regulator [Paracraurococcus lichenis]|uniref:MarR family transcriptional regulator n=1 Tax=Paracraurococcus lichenis TaxID=3064888 RepID=A0ABT9EBY5_9PROT|nr:MarR family transcriptional regulator [Paracraurococcus sp. LOR1-02]MDO9713724.1 MarR family transcriptional regulator [Paracraurococcus sp. LOR1-02]
MSAPTRPRGEFRIGFLIHDASRLRQILFDQEMRPHGVTRAQWSVLAQLSRKEAGAMTQAELARLLGLGKVTVGSMIDRLEAAGLVIRKGDALDRRIHRVFVTAKGHEIQARMVEVGRRLNAEILAGLSADEIAAADHVLTIIRRNIRRVLHDEEDAGDVSVAADEVDAG